MKSLDDLSGLMRAANRGDEIAYRTLLNVLSVWLRASIRRGLLRMNRGPEDTEDIVQETLLAVHLKRHTWDQNQPLEPWLRAIARHKLVDCLRRRGFRDYVNIDDFADVLADPAASDAAALRNWDALLKELSPREQRIVKGVSIEGKSAREVGASLDMSEGAVRVALHRILKRLADSFRRSEHEN
ncbi:MAG: sigma-70 family RNA polymerase sigma factor [Hyphomicrobiaceae bacterium]